MRLSQLLVDIRYIGMPIFKPVNHDYFKTWSPEMAYLLGYIAADGAITIGKRGNCYLDISSIDRELIRFVQTRIAPSHALTITRRKATHQFTYRIQIGSKELVRDLARCGLTPQKTWRLVLPEMPPEYLCDFVRGYFDGDGNVCYGWYKRSDRGTSRHWMQVLFTSSNKQLLLDIKQYFETAGIRFGRLRAEGNYYRLAYSRTAEIRKIYTLFYSHKPTLYLKRKFMYFTRALVQLRGVVA